MGKIRTRIIGDESVEQKQKADQKQRSQEKKSSRMKTVEADEASLAKMEKAKEILRKPSFVPTEASELRKGKKKPAPPSSKLRRAGKP